MTSTGARIAFVESPARLLLQQLSGRLDPAPESAIDDDRWPGAARLAFIVVATLALWSMIGAGMLAL